ncbi:NAD(P)-binding protein [Phenylobacterium sp.]|uniref:NAD(P)-binding protein n=1 Tax=Phenylobacterium sp. TaxID=1871053 RepID=UPI0039837C6A
MSRVRIVGGGLTGILAAFEAHRLGCRDIELHERFDRLGGVALPREAHGLELRDGCIYFGPRGDPIRSLLEWHGMAFEDVENRFGSVSPGRGGEATFTEDFGGPAIPCAEFALTHPGGATLADRLRAYPQEIEAALTRYCRWHLGAWLDEVHGSAATPLAINRVYPMGADLAALAEAKRRSPACDELYAIPRGLWGRTANLTAALPRDGFPAFFQACRAALEGLGVTIHERALVSPRQALAAHQPGEVLVWAANPTPLFKAAGVPTPKLLPKSFAAYVFKARWRGPTPFYVQNFTAQGAVFRAYIYQSRGETLLTAECVTEAEDAQLRADLARLLAGFPGDLDLGEMLGVSIQPRWIYHSADAMRRLKTLHATLAQRMGPAFVAGAWEPYAKTEKFAQVNAGLAAALEAPGAVAAA